jgi:hypothetical protein
MEEAFDLCCDGDKVSFEFNSNYTISSRVKFERKLKFHKLTTEIPLETEVEEVCTDANHFIYNWSCKYTNLTYQFKRDPRYYHIRGIGIKSARDRASLYSRKAA